MQMIPTWRPEPEQVWIRCQTVKKGSRPEELLVKFKVNGDEYMAFVPEHLVNTDIPGLMALIIGDYGDNVLIDLPTETLTTGSRISVPESEMESVIIPVT